MAEGIREFQEASKQGSRLSDPWIGLASSYIQVGDLQNAIEIRTTAGPRSHNVQEDEFVDFKVVEKLNRVDRITDVFWVSESNGFHQARAL